MIASLLTDQTLTLDNVPRLADVALLERILGNHGVDITVSGKRAGETADHGQTLHISAADIIDTTAPYDLVSKMRASFWVLAPLLARMGEARVSLPGGCAIGTRPVDLLIMAMERLGAQIEIDSGYVVAKAPHGFKGAEIVFPKVTVGGTHTAIMAASLANGTTVIENAAREPEVADVAACLDKMGRAFPAPVPSASSSKASPAQRGAPQRFARSHRNRHVCHGGRRWPEASSFTNRTPGTAAGRTRCLQATGVTVTPTAGYPRARNGGFLGRRDFDGALPRLSDRSAGAAYGADVRGRGCLDDRRDDVREPFHARAGTGAAGRTHHLDGEQATIEGVDRLKGAPVMATDLRASVSLVIAGLAAEGETIVNRVYHLDRGFERLEHKLGAAAPPSNGWRGSFAAPRTRPASAEHGSRP